MGFYSFIWAAKEIAKTLAENGVTVVSGLAYGIDKIVLLHCMDRGVFALEDVNEALKCFNLKPIVLRPWRGRPAEGPCPV